MTELGDRLRALPTFPEQLPILDPQAVPTDPMQLFRRWLDDAIEAGERQPNAMTVATVDDDGGPALRTLIVKEIDDRGLHFSSSRATRKGRHLAERPVAGMLFFWRPLGRQVEVSGPVQALSAEESARDWRERPNYDGNDNPDWQLWALQPTRWEFLQARQDRKHTRVAYEPSGDGWIHRDLAPSEAGARG